MAYPHAVTEILDQLLQGIEQALSHNLVGVYLRGSLAYGDFDADTSDIDVLVVTARAVTDAEFRRLSACHQRIAQLPNPYAKQIELAYLDKEAVRAFQPTQRHPTLERGEGESLKWQEHGWNWLLERWTVREHGTALYGPDPKTVIDPIAPALIRRAVCIRLQDWAEWARDEEDPDWHSPRSHKAYVVETMCRALYTLHTGALASKPQSVVWALENVPPPWRALVVQSQEWREDHQIDLSINPQVRRFVLWVAASSECVA